MQGNETLEQAVKAFLAEREKNPDLTTDEFCKERSGNLPNLADLLRVLTSDSDGSGTLTQPGGKTQIQPTVSVKIPEKLGAYVLKKKLGEGGMGTVYLGIDHRLERSVAVKVMRPEISSDEQARGRFLRETRAMAAIKHENVATIHAAAEEQDGTTWLAMELLEGETLDIALKRGQVFDWKTTLRIGREIALGLGAAHDKKLMHRDIKPANIWLESPTGKVKILDFGLARPLETENELTGTGAMLGTPCFMSPEHANGDAVDQRCDLFSLGVLLYRLAAGKLPFNGPTVMATITAVATKEPIPVLEHNPDCPIGLADLIHRLLAKHPHQRPANAQAVADELHWLDRDGEKTLVSRPAKIEETLPGGEQRISPPTQFGFETDADAASNVSARRRVYGMIIALMLLTGVGLGGWYLVGRDKSDAGPPVVQVNRATAPGVTATEIQVGMTGPFSGPSKDLGQQMQLGISTYFRLVNSQGGVAGRKFDLVSLDDGYDPDLALANMRELHEKRQVFACLGNVGSPTAAKTIPYTLEQKRLSFGGFSGARLLRKDPPDRYVFNYQASLEEETAAIVTYLVKIKGIDPAHIGVFAQNDAYGEDGFRGVVKTLRPLARDVKDIPKATYERNTADVDNAVREIIKRKELRAVVMMATYKPATAFIKAVRDARPDMIFTNVSFVGTETLGESLREIGPKYAEGVIVTQVVPPVDSSSSIVLKYREALKTYYPEEKPGFVSLEGFIAAAIFVEGVRRTGENLTTETMIDALETIKSFDIGIGSAINFAPSDHQASHKVWGTVFNQSGRATVLELNE